MPNEERDDDGFIYRESEIVGNDWEIYHRAANAQEGYEERLGAVRKGHNNKKYFITQVGRQGDYTINNTFKYIPLFNSKEDAARILWHLNHFLKENPLPDAVKWYLKDELRNLATKRQQALSVFHEIDRQTCDLAAIAKQYGLDWPHCSDINEEVEALVKFMDECYDNIYEKFGKDWARSFRSHVASVVRQVDPMAANKI